MRNKKSETGLMIACANGAEEVAEIFLAQKCDLEAKDAKGKTTLLHAVQNGWYTIVKRLLDHDADVNATTNLNETALHLIARKGVYNFYHNHNVKIKLCT